MARLLSQPLGVVNVGLPQFAAPIEAGGRPVSTVDWSPPAGGDAPAGMALARLAGHPRVEAANRRALQAFFAAAPVLAGVGIARECLPGMTGRMILHAGPPVAWENMCGPMQGAVIGAILYEGWASDPEAARRLAAGGDIAFEPCHHHRAVGPMAGITSPSMPVWIVEDATGGGRTYSTMNEGLGKALRFGAHGPEVIARLRWIQDTLAPTLGAALAALGGLELKPLIAQALCMGDEVHNRNVGASSLFTRRLAGPLARTRAGSLAECFEFIAGNDHFFLNVSMAACKAMLEAAHGIPDSSMVTTMARNGVEFGIRVSGLGGRWFTAPAGVIDGLYFSGYGAADAARDLGDSAITETAGLGAFSMAAAPAIVKFVGGTPADAIAHSRRMGQITLGESPVFQLPALDFRGTASGIDIRKVVDTGIEPVINTGIAHRLAGIGQIGAGVTRAPLACFVAAVRALDASLAAAG